MRFRDFIRKQINEQLYSENWRHHDPEVAHLYMGNLSITEIKDRLESKYGPMSFGEIYRSLQRSGVEPNRRQKGSYEHVLYFGRSGLSLEEISELTGYSTRHIRNIIKSQQPDII